MARPFGPAARQRGPRPIECRSDRRPEGLGNGPRNGFSTFEQRFLDLFRGDGTMCPRDTFAVPNMLSFAIDAVCPDPAVRDADDLDERQVPARVEAT